MLSSLDLLSPSLTMKLCLNFYKLKLIIWPDIFDVITIFFSPKPTTFFLLWMFLGGFRIESRSNIILLFLNASVLNKTILSMSIFAMNANSYVFYFSSLPSAKAFPFSYLINKLYRGVKFNLDFLFFGDASCWAKVGFPHPHYMRDLSLIKKSFSEQLFTSNSPLFYILSSSSSFIEDFLDFNKVCILYLFYRKFSPPL